MDVSVRLVTENSKPSRRSYLTALSAACVGSVGGCLRLAESGSEPTARTGTPGDGRTTSRDGDSTTSGGQSALRESWTLSKWGSDIVPFDGTFYASTWVSKQVYALEPDGTVQWKTDEVGKFKSDSLAVTDALVVGCAYGGQVTAFDRETGKIRWNFTGGEVPAWEVAPTVTDEYVVAVNQAMEPDAPAVVYVLNKASGDIADTFEYRGDRTNVDSTGVVDGRLVVSTTNAIDVFDLDTLSKTDTHEEGLFGTSRVHDGDLFAAVDDNVYRYGLDDSGLTQRWGASLRGSVWDLTVTDEGVVANGRGGLFKVGLDGSTKWWAKTEGRAGRAVWAGDSAVVMDEFLQLYAFDAASGDQMSRVKLPSEGSMSPISSIGSVVLTAVKPFTAFEVS